MERDREPVLDRTDPQRDDQRGLADARRSLDEKGSSVTAPIGGRIKKIHVPAREQIDAGDLLFTIVPA